MGGALVLPGRLEQVGLTTMYTEEEGDNNYGCEFNSTISSYPVEFCGRDSEATSLRSISVCAAEGERFGEWDGERAAVKVG